MLKSIRAILISLFVSVHITELAYGAEIINPSSTNEKKVEGEVRFSADEMEHDRDLDITTARGNVKIFNQGRILSADVVVYNRKQDLVSASSNIILLEPTGEVLFAEFMELSGDLKDGIIADFRAILKDGSLVAASGGRRTNANKLEMRNAVYCYFC